ncbi:hypothetical protein DRN87_00565 [Candidatus Geothermarchaeota archaeon]|nr:MAG: hypothetical protein DRN87_00565 [Candidatus Geothermarchaeota archaeon]
MKLKDKMYIIQYYMKAYSLNAYRIYNSIPDVTTREFAIINFDNIMKRHILVRDFNSFKRILIDENVKELYHSSAYYLFPDKPMDQKEWRGADLIFDIDADHIDRVRLKEVYICKKCGEVHNKPVDICIRCGGTVDKVKLIDSEALNQVKNELFKLIDILIDDFGFKEEDLKIFFSGHRGFHIHITNENILNLDGIERLEIKDYITMEGIDLVTIRDPNSRPIREIKRILREKKDELNIYFSPNEVKVIRDILNRGDINFYHFLKRIRGRRGFIEKLNKLLLKEGSVGIDGIVTVDTSRLIRAPESLHGKTGLVKSLLDLERLDGERIISESSPEEKMASVYVRYIPRLLWGDYELNETFNERIKVPLTLSIYLVNMGIAYDIRDL